MRKETFWHGVWEMNIRRTGRSKRCFDLIETAAPPRRHMKRDGTVIEANSLLVSGSFSSNMFATGVALCQPEGCRTSCLSNHMFSSHENCFCWRTTCVRLDFTLMMYRSLTSRFSLCFGKGIVLALLIAQRRQQFPWFTTTM